MQRTIDVQCVDGDIAQAPVLDVADVVALEQRIARDGTSLLELMTRAGTALARAVEAHAAPGATIVILAGSGNNGGWPRVHLPRQIATSRSSVRSSPKS